MDPQHRLFLECAYEALENAGIAPDQAPGRIGVFAGVGMGSWFQQVLLRNRALCDDVGLFLLRHTGNDKDFLSTRVSYELDLHGPSVNVQTACSTSLVAMHMAAQALLAGETDVALAGGVTIGRITDNAGGDNSVPVAAPPSMPGKVTSLLAAEDLAVVRGQVGATGTATVLASKTADMAVISMTDLPEPATGRANRHHVRVGIFSGTAAAGAFGASSQTRCCATTSPTFHSFTTRQSCFGASLPAAGSAPT